MPIAAAYFAGGPLRWPGSAAQFTYKWSTDFSVGNPGADRAVEAGANITRQSGGQLEVRVFPDSSLGTPSGILEQVRLGAVEIALSADPVTQSLVPVAGLSALPFLFPSHKDAWRVMAGPLGTYVRNAIAKAGFHAFDRSWDGAFRQMFDSARPIRNAADVKGLKIRIVASPTMIGMMKALGATPTPVSPNEVYTALQTHLIDGTEQSILSVYLRKIYEVQKYCAVTNHVWTGYNVLMNQAAWDQLPPKLRDVMQRNINAASDLCNQDTVRLDENAERQLEARGMTFTEPDIASFKAALRSAGLYGQWRDQYGPEAWSLLESAVGQLQ